jgi:steroid delta-isomerase-like uncharacterized protein
VARPRIVGISGKWRSLAAHLLWEQGVAGSNPAFPTTVDGVAARSDMIRAMDMRARIRQANDDTYAAWNAHDADAVAAVFAPDAEIVDIASGTVTRGRDAIRDTAVARFTGFPDFSLEKVLLVIDIADDGRGANADRWIMRGTHTGEFMGLAATGRAVEVQGATFSEFDAGGLVTRDTHFIDLGALLGQLGLT